MTPSPETLQVWTTRVAERLCLDPDSVPVAELLEMTRDVAHTVARPAAPLTAFLVGLAMGREMELGASAREAIASTTESVAQLLGEWHPLAREEGGA